MWNDEHAESANLDLDLQKVDHFAHLALWGAPWQKAWLEIAMLEKRWDGNTIGRMVDERTAYPDYAAKVNTSYPEPGWVLDLLQATKPSSLTSQFLAMMIGNMADGVSRDMKRLTMQIGPNEEPEKKEAAEDSKQAEAIYKEAICAFTEYVPADLEPSTINLYRSTIDLSVQTLKMALSTHLMLCGRSSEAEQLFPGIGKLADPAYSKEAVSDLIEKAVSSMMNNIEMAQLNLPAAELITGAENIEENQSYPGDETKRDDNPKHLIWSGNEDYLLKGNAAAAILKWQTAMDIIGNFIDDNGQVNAEKLADCAAIFNQTPYLMPMIGALSQPAWHLLDLNSFELAHRYLLLDKALKERHDKYNTVGLGFSKAVSEMLDYRLMGRALAGMGKVEEAEVQLLAAIEIAQLHGTAQDVTGRKIEQIVLSELELIYWILLTKANRGADADSVWQRLNSRESASRAIEKWMTERTRVGDLQSVEIVRQKLDCT
ncbi:hypothetical protein BH11CYA1_BH11CYA1_16440 [soil metagenome]